MKSYTVNLLNYNNYYNRQIKYQRTLNDYVNDGAYIIATINGMDFKMGDEITTSIDPYYSPDDFGHPDYAFVVDNDGFTSRWFVMDEYKLRNGQYKLTLRRDVVADSYEVLLDSPMYIERATASINSAFIFNREGNTYNQIKTKQTLLTDKSRFPWIVGYIDKSFGSQEITIAAESAYPILQEYSSFNAFPYYQNNSRDTMVPLSYADLGYVLYCNDGDYGPNNNYQVGIDRNGNPMTPAFNQNDVIVEGITNNTSVSNISAVGPVLKSGQKINKLMPTFVNAIQDYLQMLEDASYGFTNVPRNASSPEITTLDGAYINVAGSVYQLHVYYDVSNYMKPELEAGQSYGEINDLLEYWAEDTGVFNNTDRAQGYIQYKINGAYVKTEYIDVASSNTNIPTGRRKLADAPYDMFAIPYGKMGYRIDNTTPYFTEKEVAVKIAAQIATSLGENCYDVQFLPFCPLPDSYFSNYAGSNIVDIHTLGLTENVDFSYITTGTAKRGVMFWISRSNFTKEIAHKITVPRNNIDFKIAHETDLYRLCSPNYASVFEFSPTMNYGVEGFTVSCSYKPINPYIKICPIFKGLNGSNFTDARGLILSGDFSMSRIQDAWITYELQNKNYNEIFERQIKSMETQDKWMKIQEHAQATAGALSAAAQGAMMGNMGGFGKGGAIAGAAVFGAVSGAAGTVDVIANAALREDQRNLAKDMFRLQNENIKALPDTLTKVSAFNPDNPLLPFIEYYTATDEEKEALRQQLTYRGMTIEAISTLSNYIGTEPSYIKAQPIRLPSSIQENYHWAAELHNELNMGVYI